MIFNKLIPELYVTDFDRSLRFYHDILGFVLEYERSEPRFAFLSLEGAQLMIQELSESDGPEWKAATLEYPFGRGMNFEIDTADVEFIIDALANHGYPPRKPVWECWYECKGSRYHCKQIMVQDPDGYLLRFSQLLSVWNPEPS